MPSPICEVKDGAGAYVSTTDGVNVTPGNTITIRLVDSSARTWSISCTSTDDDSVASTVNSSLTIDSVARTATFTAPAAGHAYIFQSVVNGGVGPNGRVTSSYTTTFGVYTLTADGLRVLAANETTEGDSAFGWSKSVNAVIRTGGGSASVADDIQKNAGVIDRVVGIRGVTVENATPAVGETLVKRGSSYVFDKPVMPGWYDPRDYGAVLDGTTDDLPAFQAMLAAMPDTGGVVHLPPGVAWLSDTWEINKPIEIRCPSGGNSQYNSGFEVAPGSTALWFQSFWISVPGAERFKVSGISLKSKVLVHDQANGSALGQGIGNAWNTAAIRKGDCIVASAGAHPTKFFRCTDTGLGTAAKTLTTEPTWDTTVGAPTVHEGVTFVCELFPTVRANSTAYAQYDRVYAASDNRFYYECEVAGTSAASPPAEMVGGDSAPGIAIGTTVTDGTVTWRVKTAAGAIMGAPNGRFGNAFIRGFSGAGIMIWGGFGMFAAGQSDANHSKVHDVWIEYCGLGLATAGSDCNGWTIDNAFVFSCGLHQPTPNASSAAGYQGLGGHGLHDKSLAAGQVSNLYAQLSSGRPILKNGNGRLTAVSCFTEVGDACHLTGGTTTILGGTIYADSTSDSVIHLDFTYGQGLVTRGSMSGQATIQTMFSASKAFTLQAPTATDAANFYGWSYGYGTPAGWWGWQHGNLQLRNAFIVSTSNAGGSNPGPGWACFEQGFLYGTPGTELFFGPMSVYTNRELRNGLRRTGDRFVSTTVIRRATSDGYKGVPWTATTAVGAGWEDIGQPAYHVEPTANTGTNAGGEQVWRCTTAGTTGAVEPAWPGAPVAGVTTQADGTAVWTYVGATPSHTDSAV